MKGTTKEQESRESIHVRRISGSEIVIVRGKRFRKSRRLRTHCIPYAQGRKTHHKFVCEVTRTRQNTAEYIRFHACAHEPTVEESSTAISTAEHIWPT